MTQGDLPPLPPQHPGGFIWEPHAGRMRIVTDAEWGNLASTLLPSVQQAAARLANRHINGANRRPDLCASAELLTTLLAGEIDNIAAHAPAIYMESIFLGETMAADTALRQSPDPMGEPLSDEMRAALAALMRGLPAFVRSFPTVQAMDDHNAAFFAEVVQVAPVQRLTDAAEAHKVIDPADSAPLRRGLQTGWEAGPFHQRGPRASQTSMRNLVLAAVVAGSAAVSAGFLGEIGAAVNRGLGLPHQIENWTKQSKDDLHALFQTAPADIAQAVLLHLDALGKAPPVQPPEPPTPKGRTWIVDPDSGRGDFMTIQAAIDAATDDETVLVREGRYHESLRLEKGIHIRGYGDIANIVVVSVRGSALHCSSGSGKISGLSLLSESKGRGLALLISAGSPQFDSCTIRSFSQASAVIRGKQTSPTIVGCQFTDGAMEGVIISGGASPTFIASDFSRNSKAGVSIRDKNTAVRFIECEALDGKAGGFLFRDNAGGVLVNCKAIGNAHQGVAIGSNAKVKLNNCQIDGNLQMGALIFEHGEALFDTCTISSNKGNGIWVQENGAVTVIKSALKGNRQSAVWIPDPNSTGTFRNNDMRGNGKGPWKIAEGATVIDENNLT